MRSAHYRSYTLVLLLILFAFSSVDNVFLGLVAQKIELGLSLSDAQLGLFSGILFALFYSVAGIPLARWADRGNRVTIIVLTAAIWSTAVTLYGAAGSALQFVIFRISAAVGESGYLCTASSLVSDYFSRAERSRAISRLLLGGPLSYLLGYFFGGWLDECYGWRATFAIIGAPGIALAVLAWMTLKEPRREKQAREICRGFVEPQEISVLPLVQPGLREVCVQLISNQTFRQLLFSYSLIAFAVAGSYQWLPTFFIRQFGVETGVLGTWFAAIFCLSTALGTYWGGELASRYANNNERLQMKSMALVNILSGVFATLVYLSSNVYVAFGLLAASFFCGSLLTGPMAALTQTLVPQRRRAQSTAIQFLFTNFIGFGLGPGAVGALSDALRPWAAQGGGLRAALVALAPCYLWAAWHLWLSSRTVTRDLQAVEADDCDIADGVPSRQTTVRSSL